MPGSWCSSRYFMTSPRSQPKLSSIPMPAWMTPSLMSTMVSSGFSARREAYTFLPSMLCSFLSKLPHLPSRMRMASGLSNSNSQPLPSSSTWTTEKVAYATPRTLHTGSVCTTVSTHSSMPTSLDIMVQRILEVRVARMFALTPLPSPSASTTVVCLPSENCSTLSPHSSSPFLLREV